MVIDKNISCQNKCPTHLVVCLRENANDGNDLVLLGSHAVQRSPYTLHEVRVDGVHELEHVFLTGARVEEQKLQ